MVMEVKQRIVIGDVFVPFHHVPGQLRVLADVITEPDGKGL